MYTNSKTKSVIDCPSYNWTKYGILLVRFPTVGRCEERLQAHYTSDHKEQYSTRKAGFVEEYNAKLECRCQLVILMPKN